MVNPFTRFYNFLFEEPKLAPMTLQIHTEEVGAVGTESYSGYPAEEYLQKMKGTERADIFDKMRRSDYQITMCLAAVMNPIKDANWRVEESEDTPEAKHHADFIKHVLFDDMKSCWTDILHEMLGTIIYGHSVHEIVHKVVVGHETFGDYVGINNLAFRSPKTLERWNIDKSGHLISVTQQANGDSSFFGELPAQFLLVLSLQKEGANYEGISMLRPCYGPFFRKCEYLKLNAIGIEKFAVPTPIAEYPADQEGKAQYNMMKNVLKAYVTHQQQYIIHPAGWSIKLESNAYDPQKVETSIDNEDKRISKAFLANFLELGMGTTGSYSLSNDLSDFFLSGIKHIAYGIADGVSKKVIKDLIDLNFGEQASYPKLMADGISDKAGKELAEILTSLSSSKVITPDDKLEEVIRQRYDLPLRDELTARKQDAAPAMFSDKSMMGQFLKLQEKNNG